MTDCATQRPYHQAQLVKRFGGASGKFNCTACAAAMVAEAASCGKKWAITGAMVRRATDEATPDPKSPGLNLRQVADAVDDLTHGRVQLVVRQQLRWKYLESRLRRGEVAVLQVWRQVFIDQGFGFGNTFHKGHAVAIGFDHGQLWVDDPLTRKFFPTWDQLADAAAALELGNRTVGAGFAWAAFAARTKPVVQVALAPTHRVRIRPGDIWSYELANGMIEDRTVFTVTAPISLPCSAPTRFPADPNGKRAGIPQQLVIVMGGSLKGRGVRDSSSLIDVIEPDDDGVPDGAPEAAPAGGVVHGAGSGGVALAAEPEAPPALDDADAEQVRNDGVDEPMLPDDTPDPVEGTDLVPDD